MMGELMCQGNRILEPIQSVFSSIIAQNYCVKEHRFSCNSQQVLIDGLTGG